jgi:adenine C2-methylase RlmN of 23S rRNA A2503 and tRNA A37
MLELQKVRGTAFRLLRKTEVHVKRKITLKLYNLHPHEFFNENVKDKLDEFGRSKHVWSVRVNIATNEHREIDRQGNGGNLEKNYNISNQICLKYIYR